MSDLLLTDDGNLLLSPDGDILTLRAANGATDRFHHLSQQAYIRMMTEPGDFLIPGWERIGVNLSLLHGMPNTEETGKFGENLILDALNRENVFTNEAASISVRAVPVSYDTIRFDITVLAGSRREMILSIEQSLVEQPVAELPEPTFPPSPEDPEWIEDPNESGLFQVPGDWIESPPGSGYWIVPGEIE